MAKSEKAKKAMLDAALAEPMELAESGRISDDSKSTEIPAGKITQFPGAENTSAHSGRISAQPTADITEVTAEKITAPEAAAAEITINSTSYDFIRTDEELTAALKEAINNINYNAWSDFKADKFLLSFRYSCNSFVLKVCYNGSYSNYGSAYFYGTSCMNHKKEIINLEGLLKQFREQADRALYVCLKSIPKYKEELINIQLQLIKDEFSGIKVSFVKLGFILRRMQNDSLYDTKEDFYTYIDSLFGMSKTTVKELISVFETFCKRINGAIVPELEDGYKEYSHSQLVAILPLDSSERKKIRPEMSIQEIREYKQKLKDKFLNKAGKIDKDAESAEISPQKLETIEETTPPKAPTGLIFKNDIEREKWVNDYKNHAYLWVDIPPLTIKVYRYDFINSASLIITEFTNGGFNCQIISSDKEKFKHDYSVKQSFNFSTLTVNQVVNWIKENRSYI